jgi:hypothetical protein
VDPVALVRDSEMDVYYRNNPMKSFPESAIIQKDEADDDMMVKVEFEMHLEVMKGFGECENLQSRLKKKREKKREKRIIYDVGVGPSSLLQAQFGAFLPHCLEDIDRTYLY